GLDREIGADGVLGRSEQAVVLRVLDDPVERHRFERGQRHALAVLAPRLAEEAANVVARRGEHDGLGAVRFGPAARAAAAPRTARASWGGARTDRRSGSASIPA